MQGFQPTVCGLPGARWLADQFRLRFVEIFW
jgi:hypothetical protein